MLQAAGILTVFDRAAEQRRFPEPAHPYSYLMAARLHAFGDADRWALVVETVGYNPRAANVVDVMHGVGNCLLGTTEHWGTQHLRRVDNFQDLFDDRPWPPRYRQLPITVRGHELHVDAAPTIAAQDLFRLLVPDHKDLLLGDEVELRHLVPADLPRLLSLDDWHHTALRVKPPSAERERARLRHDSLMRHVPPDQRVPFEVRPSDIETYRQIAEVLATADPNKYQPTLPPNTHWTNWPMSGAL
ncbi:DUF7003 family protein [Phytohabitans aurantiacus]|uniref:DUF7003 family protein n=1 Tax=Phytohabitans aurantiacus TaxID=3016789 RepID=UPI00249309D8|nr:hypothetical protein [Phytohabitans aurantiacus]